MLREEAEVERDKNGLQEEPGKEERGMRRRKKSMK